ncbi:MAG: 50S ribosomal protein L23 [Kiritimatiellae bacterium]|nr:50S ribosomal protein L23 [Kiritimatiellia bacterium]
MANEEVKSQTKEIVKKVRITEKGEELARQNRYVVEVAVDARKPEIADAVEKKFGVHVLAVRTVTVKGGRKYIRGTRRVLEAAPYKKAIVTVKEGERIEQV